MSLPVSAIWLSHFSRRGNNGTLLVRACRDSDTGDYERLPEHHEGVPSVVMIRLMLRGLTRNHGTWKSKTT
ncbi:MAG: hypothetical protein KME42_13325 [Tildeniella nuda ZEHNDER 1965/U140]|jgi:hypothetical protein|nr:hypothetical protein [Tildeniella nuda ZEHNDER 1965/U140]